MYFIISVNNLIFISTVIISLLNVQFAFGRARKTFRDFIATDHSDASSARKSRPLESRPMSELSRKEMIEVLHSGQYFQDLFMEHLAPQKIQFGHVCEDPFEWQQRFELNDFDSKRFQGKVRWGNANGNYGEQYWDLGHAGKK